MADNYTDSLDGYFLQALEQDLGVPSKTVNGWRTAWAKKPNTYTDKANYMQAIYNIVDNIPNIDKVALVTAAGEWAQSYNPDLVHSDGTPYTLTEFKTAIQNDNLTKDKSLINDRDALGKTIAASLGNDLTTADITAGAKSIMEGSTAKPYDPSEVSYLYRNAVGPDAISPTDTVDSLTVKYGNLKTATGKPLFTTTEIKNAVAGSSTAKQAFNTKVRNLVDTTVSKNSDLVKGSKSYVEAANKLLADAPTLESTYNTKVSGLTKNADTGAWESGKSNVVTSDPTGTPGTSGTTSTSGTYDYTGGIGQLSTNGKIDPAKMANMVNSYDTQKGVWSLPSINKDTGLFEAGTSPYENLLVNSLNNFASKGDYYSPGYVNSLASKQPAAISSTDMPSLKATFTDPGTSKDLLNLANSVGTDYATANDKGGIPAGSKLSPTLLKAYQPITTTNATGQQSTAAKPGAPDLTSSTVPKTTAPVTALPTTTPGLLTPPIIKTKEQADADKKIADEKLRIEQEKLAKENAEKLKLNQPWYKAGFISPEEYSAAMALGFSDKLSYDNYLKNLRTATVKGGTGTDTLPGGTKTDTLVGKDIGQPKKSYYDPVNNPNGDWVYIAGVQDPVPRYGVGPDGTQHDYGTEGVSLWNNQLVTPKELEAINNYYKTNQLVHSDNGKIQSGFDQAKLALGNSQFVTPTAPVTSPGVTSLEGIAANTSNFTTPENMNTNAGGIPTVLPAQQSAQQPNAQLDAITTTDQTGTIYNWSPNAGVWVPQNQPERVSSKGIAANTSNFTTPENMNTNAGGIPTVLPAQQSAAAPASDIPGVYGVGGAGPGTWEYANAQAKAQRMAAETAAGQQRLAAIMAQKGLPYP